MRVTSLLARAASVAFAACLPAQTLIPLDNAPLAKANVCDALRIVTVSGFDNWVDDPSNPTNLTNTKKEALKERVKARIAGVKKAKKKKKILVFPIPREALVLAFTTDEHREDEPGGNPLDPDSRKEASTPAVGEGDELTVIDSDHAESGSDGLYELLELALTLLHEGERLVDSVCVYTTAYHNLGLEGGGGAPAVPYAFWTTEELLNMKDWLKVQIELLEDDLAILYYIHQSVLGGSGSVADDVLESQIQVAGQREVFVDIQSGVCQELTARGVVV